MKEQLRQGSEHLRKAVVCMAISPAKTGFGSIAEYDSPRGALRDDFQAIAGQISRGIESQFLIQHVSLDA